MDTTKDTALAAMKRAAKAVLRDELKLLRWQLRHQKVVVAEAQSNAEYYRRNRDLVCHELAQLKRRVGQVYDWGLKNRSGDFAIRACTEYIQQGAKAHTYGAGAMYINPFDRWQVNPPIRDDA